MILKKIELYGFKSFGKKTEIDFDEPITGIVGPNGSGKSNIVDAIRWVLGEQRVKSLRGSKMEDVIFSGTEEKKALGYAQVTLYLDNCNHKFPLEYEEISVARRLFRSGESEYYLNKNLCRLKDIQELFMDTGLGREGYSIISQGQIESIVNSSAYDRKLLIEEAVGIVKYKTRKMEAERKLEKAQNNLYRITDILAELETRLPSLKRQSEKAEKFLAYRNELKDIEINIFVHQMENLNARLSKYTEDKNAISESLHGIDTELTSLDSRYTVLKNDVSMYDESIAELNERIHELITNFENSKTEISVSKSKVESYETSIVDAQKEIAESVQESETLHKSEAEISSELQTALQSLESAKGEFENKKTVAQALEEQYLQGDTAINVLKENIRRAEQEIAETRDTISKVSSDLANLEYLVKTNQEEASRMQKEAEQTVSQADTEQAGIADLTEIKQKYDTISLQLKEAADAYDRFKEKAANLYAQLQTQESKLQMMHGYENSMQGYRYAVRKLMQMRETDAKLRPTLYGTVGELIHTDGQYAEALTKALGAAIENLVVENEETAKRCIALLKQNKWGRATFLPKNIIKPSPKTTDASVEKLDGLIGYANQLIHCEDRFRVVADQLLGRVLVIDNIDHAVLAARKTSHRYKIVTLDGEVMLPGGAMIGGNSKDQEQGVLKRRAQIEDLQKNVAAIKAEYESLLTQKNDYIASINQLQEDQNRVQNDYNTCRETHAVKLEKIRLLRAQVDELKKNIGSKRLAATNAALQAEQKKNELKLLQDAVQTMQGKLTEMQDNLTKASSGGYKEDYFKALTAKNDTEIAFIQARESVSQWSERLNHVQERIEADERLSRQKEDLIEKWQEEITLLRQRIESCTQIDHDYDLARKELDEQYARMTKEKKEANREFIEVNDEIMARNKERNSVSEQIAKIDVQIGKIELETEHLQSGIWEDYSLTYAAALQYKTEISDLSGSIAHVSELKEKIRKLGNINVDALEEYKEVKERFETMTVQRDDLMQSKEDLVKIIKDISLGMVQQFMQQFELIQKEFNEVFVRMFNGGEAHLVLTDPEDVMESGVEIIARPPKTKLKNIAALSGGEKAMTAVSLIFAILRIKPAPFCVLDEIDAALDDANALRFCEYLLSIKNDNQFVIITHKKKTMEIADTLYGASMGKEGITELYSVRISQLNEKGEVYAG